MKVFVSLLLIVMLATGYSLAGCGKKENDEGTLTAVNSGSKTSSKPESRVLVVVAIHNAC